MDFYMLNMLLKSSKEFSHEKIKSCGLTDTECFICSYVFRHEDCSQDDAVQGLRIDKTTAAKAIQSLEEKGYIERSADKSDRRKKNLKITEYGGERCREIIHLHDNWFSGIMSALTDEEQAQFENCCVKLLNKAEEMSASQKR